MLVRTKGAKHAMSTTVSDVKARTDLLAWSLQAQARHETSTSPMDRKNRGQFFTPGTIARFMASLFTSFPPQFRLLDPGAGTGTLAAAVCERVLRLRRRRHIELHLFETDSDIIPLLDDTMAFCRAALEEAGHTVSLSIHHADFILRNSRCFGQQSLFNPDPSLHAFDAVIMNPPYFKIARDSEYAKVMERIVHGQPNIYALFMALAAQMLRPGGEMVAITPRSFCNGAYFRGFRRWFFRSMSLRHIHSFESRTDTFRGANVLQESIISLTQKQTEPPENVTITTSFGGDIPKNPASHQVASDRIIDDTSSDVVIRIPENEQDGRIMDLVDAWPERFQHEGLRVSTGPVVMFRAKEFLLSTSTGADAAPLLSVHNVRPFEVLWPVHKKNKPTAFRVCSQSLRLLVPTKNYVLLRRFSAKEERRRLTASCFLKSCQTSAYVALENHLNYVYHVERDLTDNEVYGLAALFNSALLDRYFRTISGNTQVNATELRRMPFPALKTVAQIGKHVRSHDKISPTEVERIVLHALGIDSDIEEYLAGYAL